MPSLKERLIEINKKFHDGSTRYEGELDGLEYHINCLLNLKKGTKESILHTAKRIAMRHPFIDGNKRTAIKYAEIMLKEKVPDWVYFILDF